MCVRTYTHIYIYIYRERERDREILRFIFNWALGLMSRVFVNGLGGHG